MHQLRRVTNSVAWDGVLPHLANSFIRKGACHNLKTQMRKESVPKRNHTLFIHLKSENSRLAFGKKAQNVRLAQKLVGWAIKFIIDDAEQRETFEDKKTRIIETLASSVGISAEAAAVLVNNGYLTLDGLRAADMSDIAALKGLDDTALVAIAAARTKE